MVVIVSHPILLIALLVHSYESLCLVLEWGSQNFVSEFKISFSISIHVVHERSKRDFIAEILSTILHFSMVKQS